MKIPILPVKVPSPVGPMFDYREGNSQDVRFDPRHTLTNNPEYYYGTVHTRGLRHHGPCKRDQNSNTKSNVNVNSSTRGY